MDSNALSDGSATGGAEPIRALLRDSALCRGLAEARLAELARAATYRSVPTGHTLLTQGAAPVLLHLVASGAFKMSQVQPDGHQITVRYMGPGDLIGCVAVIRKVPYPVSAIAAGNAAVCSWPAAHIHHLLSRDRQFAQNTLEIVSGRAEALLSRLSEGDNEAAEPRLARIVTELAMRFGKRSERGIEIGIPLSRHDLAELAGGTHYTVSRIISAWEERELVTSGRRKLAVTDLDALRRIAPAKARRS